MTQPTRVGNVFASAARADTLSAQIKMQGNRLIGAGVSSLLQGVGANLAHKRARKERKEDLNTQIRAQEASDARRSQSQSALEDQRHSNRLALIEAEGSQRSARQAAALAAESAGQSAERSALDQAIREIAGDSMDKQAMIRREAQDLQNLEKIAFQMESNGADTSEIKTKIEEKRNGLAGLAERRSRDLQKLRLRGVPADEDQMANTIEDQAALEDRIIEGQEKVRQISALQSRALRSKASTPEQRQALSDAKVAEEKRLNRLARRRNASAEMLREKKIEEARDRANAEQGAAFAKWLKDSKLKLGDYAGLLREVESGMTSAEDASRQVASQIKAVQDRAAEEQAQADKEFAQADDRLAMEKAVSEAEFDDTERDAVMRVMKSKGFAQAFNEFQDIQGRKRALQKASASKPLSTTSSASQIDKGLKAKDANTGLEKPDLSGLSEEAMASGLSDRSRSAEWAKRALEARYKVSGMNRGQRARLAIRLVKALPADEQEAFAHRLKEAMGL